MLVDLAHVAGLLGAEVDRMHPHRLSTFVTILLDRGQGLAAVQDAARHASADTTRLYDRKRDAYCAACEVRLERRESQTDPRSKL